MNVPKFQFCLNHDDPSIVKVGLSGFLSQILSDHNAVSSFGYNGRAESFAPDEVIFVPSVQQVTGLLSAYLTSSPKAEEFFVLWSLQERDGDKELCTTHTQCAAAIIHCAISTGASFVNTFVSRIIGEFSSSLLRQLSSDHLGLVHATLGLLIMICRVSRSFTLTVLDTFIMTNSVSSGTSEVTVSPAFVSCSKVGKSVKWKCRGRSEKMFLDTDSRFLINLLILTIIMKIDDNVSISESIGAIALRQELLGPNSLLRKVLVGLAKDQYSTIRLLLEGLILLERRSVTAGFSWTSLCLQAIDYSVLPKVVSIYKHQNVSAQECIHNFIRYYCSQFKENNSSHKGVANTLLRSLQAHTDIKHREVRLFSLSLAFSFYYSLFL